TCHSFGRQLTLAGQSEKAMGWHDRAIRTLETALRRDPQNAEAKTVLCYTRVMRAHALTDLQRYAEAMADWNIALGLGKADARFVRVLRAQTVAQSGDHAAAAAELGAMAKPEQAELPAWEVASAYGWAMNAAARDDKLSPSQRQQSLDDYAGVI